MHRNRWRGIDRTMAQRKNAGSVRAGERRQKIRAKVLLGLFGLVPVVTVLALLVRH